MSKPQTTVDSGPQHTNCAQRDICDGERRALLTAKLQQAQKMEAAGHLAAGLAHDLKNLLTAVRLHADLIAAALPPGAPQQKNLGHIRTSAEHGAVLVNRLLAFSRPQHEEPACMRVDEVLVGAADTLQMVAGEQVQLRTDLAPDLPSIAASTVELQQVLLNCAMNARSAMPMGGVLEISAKKVRLDAVEASETQPPLRAGVYLQITVRDTGRGMDAEQLRHAFEPFATSCQESGTGLGLMMIHAIVTRAGGAVSLSSEPGQGTVVTMLFPAGRARTVRSAQRRKEKQDNRDLREAD